MLREDVEAGRGLFDLTDALPRLLAGEAGQFAERAFVGSDIEEIVAEDREHPILVHARDHQQEGEVALRAFAAPERAVMAAELEVTVAAREDVVEAGLAREQFCDARFRIRTKEREIRKGTAC